MTKLIEFNFCSFSGSVPVDEVSGTTLSGTVNGSPSIVSPLPSMTNRPGIRFLVNNVADNYTFPQAAADGLKMASLYMPTQRRSFVLWYYCHSSSHDATSTNYIWGGDASGFAVQTTGLRYIRDSSAVYTTSTGTNVGWHNAVVTIDRVAPAYKCYYKGSLVYSDTTVPATTNSGLSTVLGQAATDRESDISFGYVATYDTILDATTVSGIYQDFIRDSAAGNEPLAVLSGIILDINDQPTSGTPFYLIKTSDGQIYNRGVTSSSGTYTLDVPFSGHYVAVASTTPPNLGARAISLAASTSGTVTYYDGS